MTDTFTPYVKAHGIAGLHFWFMTQEAMDWYDPLKPYTKLEYEWVRDNVVLRGQTIIDAGCHHGNYSVLFGEAAALFCVDPHNGNCAITRTNLELNHIKGEVCQCAIMAYNGECGFNGQSNGRVGAGKPVACVTLDTICSRANVVKLDVEGAEFFILPDAIDDMPRVHTWIVEVHPTDGNPNDLIRGFHEKDYEVLKVDRNLMEVVPIAEATDWTSHATIIARRK